MPLLELRAQSGETVYRTKGVLKMHWPEGNGPKGIVRLWSSSDGGESWEAGFFFNGSGEHLTPKGCEVDVERGTGFKVPCSLVAGHKGGHR